jgi:class 3 adenylate cyclase
MLFADAVGFSRLSEEQVPLFVRHFLGAVGTLRDRTSARPVMQNTWGDGLFFVFETLVGAGRFALELCELVTSTDWAACGLPTEMNLRIGLHAGPVYREIDPVTGLTNYFGAHVSRAARIEPITPPGHVYASEAFAALHAAQGAAELICDYVGQTPLAKGYGTFPTYHVRRQPC